MRHPAHSIASPSGVAGVLIVLFGLHTAAQTPVFRTGALTVSVNASVKKGNKAVANLTAKDFRLTDNGVEQRIEAVAIESVPVDVTLFLDTSGSTSGKLDEMKRDVQGIIRLLRPGDRFRLLTIGDSVDELTYVSEFCRDRIAPALSDLAAARMRRLSPRVDRDRFHPGCGGDEVRRRLGIAPDAPVVVCVARLVRRKGQDTLIRLWPELLRSFPDAVLLLVGDGPDRRRLDRMAARRGIDGSVLRVGSVPWEEVPAYFSSPEQPAAYFADNMKTLSLMAKDWLRPEATYRAEFTAVVDGKEWRGETTFTTGGEKALVEEK